MSVPGLTVIFGSHGHNVGQLLVDATTRWLNPVVFLEHKLLYGEAQRRPTTGVAASRSDVAANLFDVASGGGRPDVSLVIRWHAAAGPGADRRLQDEGNWRSSCHTESPCFPRCRGIR